jgi:hypothetical protein
MPIKQNAIVTEIDGASMLGLSGPHTRGTVAITPSTSPYAIHRSPVRRWHQGSAATLVDGGCV